MRWVVALAGMWICACGRGAPPVPADSGPGPDAGEVPDAGSSTDGGSDAGASPDAGTDGGCFISTVGVYGTCMTTADCSAMSGYSSTPGYCPGPADIECCSPTPSVANNPPVPTGWALMPQASVTPAMTHWAVAILHDPVTYPMFSTATQMFGSLNVMARVEWHPPDFQNNTVHRGVTLYQPG